MAAAGGHWLKIAQGNIGSLVFVPKGQTAAGVITGRKPEPAAFPASPGDTQKVKGLGGSTGATLVQDSGGNLYVKKSGASGEHLLEEGITDDGYRALGLDVPASQVYQTPNGPVKLSKFVEGQTMGQLQNNDPAKFDKAVTEVRKGFVADALLANHDVMGLNYDNVIVGKNGKLYRIDNGGGLRYRAQGEKRPIG